MIKGPGEPQKGKTLLHTNSLKVAGPTGKDFRQTDLHSNSIEFPNQRDSKGVDISSRDSKEISFAKPESKSNLKQTLADFDFSDFDDFDYVAPPKEPEKAIVEQVPEVEEQEEEAGADIEDIDAIIEGRERNTMSFATFSNPIQQISLGVPTGKGPQLVMTDEQMAFNLAKNLKQAEAKEPTVLINPINIIRERAQEKSPEVKEEATFSDVSLSEDEEYGNSGSLTVMKDAFSGVANIGTMLSLTPNKKKVVEQETKMHSTFLNGPRMAFNTILQAYNEEIFKIKDSAGKLEIDMDVINQDLQNEKVQEITETPLNSKLQEIITSKYGIIRCTLCDHLREFLLIGTIEGHLLVYEIKSEYISHVQTGSAQDYPSALYIDRKTETVIIGTSAGNILFYKLSKFEKTVKKLNTMRGISTKEILEMTPLFNFTQLVYLDSECRLIQAKAEKGKTIERAKLEFSEIGNCRRDQIPRLTSLQIKEDYALLITTSGKAVQIFDIKESVKAKPGQTKPTLRPISSFQCEFNSFPRITIQENPSEPLPPSPEAPAEPELRLKESLCLVMELKDSRRFLLLVACDAFVFVFEMHLDTESGLKQRQIGKIELDLPATLVNRFGESFLMLKDMANSYYLVDILHFYQTSLGDPKANSRKSDPNKQLRRFCQEETKSSPEQHYNKDFVFPLLLNLSKENEPLGVKLTVAGMPFLSYTRLSQGFERSILSIDQSSLLSFELKTWKAYLEECFQREYYNLAFKALNEMLDGENALLRDLPPRKTLSGDLAPYLIRAITEFIPFLKIQAKEDIQRMTNYMVVSLYKNGMQDYILGELEELFTQHEILGYYIANLIIMFESRLFLSLELEKLLKIISFLENNPLEKQRFILFLFNKRLHRDILFSNLANRGNINLLFYCCDKVDDPSKSVYALEYLKCNIENATSEKEVTTNIFNIFWFIFEFVHLRLQKSDIKYKDSYWYILNWIFNEENLLFLARANFKAFLECWFMLFDKGFTQSLLMCLGMDFVDKAQKENVFMDSKKSEPHMIFLFNILFKMVREDPRELHYLYFYIAMLKFKNIQGIELNEAYLKELVFDLIIHINDIVSEERLSVDHEDLNILIFATFTEHKELFMDNNELKELIKKNEYYWSY